MKLSDIVVRRARGDTETRVNVFSDFVDLKFTDGFPHKVFAEQLDGAVRISPEDGTEIQYVSLERHLPEQTIDEACFVCSSKGNVAIKIYGENYAIYYNPQAPV